MRKNRYLGFSARILIFIIPIIIGSLLLGGLYNGIYADRGVKKAMRRLMVYKSQDILRYANSQWDLLLENGLTSDLTYLESLRKSVRSYSISMLREDTEWILAIDEDDQIVFSVGPAFEDDYIRVMLDQLLPINSEELWIETSIGGDDRIGYGFRIPALGWTIFITDDRQSYYSDNTNLKINYIIMAVFTALLSSIAIILFVHRSMKPLKSINADIGNIINNHDFSRRVAVVQHDEIGELAGNFNKLSKYLEKSLSLLKDVAHKEIAARIEVKERERETLDVLSKASDVKDEETGKHTTRVGLYASLLSELRGDNADQVDMIRWAAPLHDLGKLGIRDSLLLKSGKLTTEERTEMMTHAQIGHDILAGTESPMLRAGAIIAISHHERWNGSGYPAGLKGEEIPISGRITGLVDVFDALTTERPYKEAWTPERAFDLIRDNSGSDFDPEIVELFINRFDRILEIFTTHSDDDSVDAALN